MFSTQWVQMISRYGHNTSECKVMPILRQSVSNAMMNIQAASPKSSFALVLPTQHLRIVKGVRNCVLGNIRLKLVVCIISAHPVLSTFFLVSCFQILVF